MWFKELLSLRALSSLLWCDVLTAFCIEQWLATSESPTQRPVKMFMCLVVGCAAVWRDHFRSVSRSWISAARLWCLPRSTDGKRCKEKVAACLVVYSENHSGVLSTFLTGTGVLSRFLTGTGLLSRFLTGTDVLSRFLTVTGVLSRFLTGTGVLSRFLTGTCVLSRLLTATGVLSRFLTGTGKLSTFLTGTGMSTLIYRSGINWCEM